MYKRNVLNSPRLSELKKKRRQAVQYKFLIVFFTVLIVGGSLSYFSRMDGLNISNLVITGNEVVDSNLIESAVKEKIGGKYLWLFPKSNVLFYPKSAIADELYSKFGRLSNVDLDVKERKTLTVSVEEREGKYMWCGEKPPVANSTEEKCYFLDKSGYIFDDAPYFSGEVYFKFYGSPGISLAEPKGSTFYEKNFTHLAMFKDVVASLGANPTNIFILDDEDGEMLLRKGDKNTTAPKIKFRADADLQNVAENLKAAFDTEPLKSDFKNKYSKLSYIDLRFGNKVYFKFND